jgi:two-component system sensor histidine kinase MprB
MAADEIGAPAGEIGAPAGGIGAPAGGVGAPAARRRRVPTSLRTRMTLATALAVAALSVGMAAFAYLAQRSATYHAVDGVLATQFAGYAGGYGADTDHDHDNVRLPDGTGPDGIVAALVHADGTVVRPPTATVTLQVPEQVRALARTGGPGRTFTLAGDDEYRAYAAPVAPGVAVLLAAPLTRQIRSLHRLGWELTIAALVAVGVAALLGWLVSRAALAPLRRLTRMAERVAATRDLDHRIEEPRRDELGRLAGSMNAMLAALGDSVRTQRQLVADASHELRTPLTSLQTNAEVFRRSAELSPLERSRLAEEVVEQVGELTRLVADITELGRGDQPPAHPEDVDVDDVVAAELGRARRHWPEIAFAAELRPVTVPGERGGLARAVANLLDNAAKFSPNGGPVEIVLTGRTLVVRDHGAGIPAEDLGHVFDRFYRSANARGRPGSGLGLAIVRQVAQSLGGSVSATLPPGGGTEVVLDLGPHATAR